MSAVCFEMKESTEIAIASATGKHRLNKQTKLTPTHHFAQIIEAALGDHVLETLDNFLKTLQDSFRRRSSLVAAAAVAAAISGSGPFQHFPNKIGDGSLQRRKPKYLPRSNLHQD